MNGKVLSERLKVRKFIKIQQTSVVFKHLLHSFIYHNIGKVQMNSQNQDQQNSSWRQASYLQESRNQAISRPDNYYPHYPSPQIVNDYLPSGYVYPGLMPPFRPGEFNIPPINEQWNPSFGLMPSETYSKFYNKSQPFNIQNSQFAPKNYPNDNNFFEKPQDYRPQTPYDEPELKHIQTIQGPQSSAYPPSGYPNQEFLRIQKVSKTKNVIIIESDDDNDEHQNGQEAIKIAPQKEEQKPAKQLSRGNQIQQKKIQFGIDIQQKSKENQTISQVSPIILENNPYSGQNILSGREHKPQVHQSNHEIYTNLPSFKIPIGQYVPLKVVADLYKETMEELQVAQIPDITMKLFLKFKIMEARSMYEETEEESFKVFNLLKIYRTIILFQIQRKNFIECVLSQQILAVSKYSSKQQKGTVHNQKVQTRLSQLYKDNQQNLKIRIQTNDLKDKNKFGNQGNQTYRSEYLRNGYQPKTKKISKRQSSQHNSQEVSFNARNKYLEKYDLEPNQLICDRKLRQRKKKKNRRNQIQKGIDHKYNKDKLTQRQNSKSQKQIHEKDNHKKNPDLSHQDEGIIEKIKIWADKTVLADAIQQKHKKSLQKEKPKNSSNQNNTKNDPFKVIKKDQLTKKNKERYTKSSQTAFRQELAQKILEAKSNKQTLTPNLITFATSNNLTEIEKEEYQRELSHLIKEMKNNDSHGKIRVGKEYFQAKMPNFIRSDIEMRMMIKEKRQRLMQRKMTVFTF